LAGGEQIRVPEAGKIFVVGNVKKPGAFSVHDALGNTTVLTAIAMSEGLDQYASKTAYIYRQEPGRTEKTEIAVALQSIMNRKGADQPLAPNDILYIPQNTGKKMTLGMIERIAGIGASSVPAVIYSTR
jgi:polysaccharide export outer membrane protein